MTSASPHVEMNASAEQCERAQHSLLNSFGPDLPQARQKYECQAAGVATVKSLLPEIGITKRTLKKLETIQLIRAQRDAGKQELAYNAGPFVLCGIPLRRPPREQLTYVRHNGRFLLEITVHPRYGFMVCVFLSFARRRP